MFYRVTTRTHQETKVAYQGTNYEEAQKVYHQKAALDHFGQGHYQETRIEEFIQEPSPEARGRELSGESS